MGRAQRRQLPTPEGIATDSSGNVYVADTDNNRIQKFDSSGTSSPSGEPRLRRRPVQRPEGSPPTPRATSTSPTRQRPDPEVRLLGDLPHQVGKLAAPGTASSTPPRRRHRLLGQRLRHRHRTTGSRSSTPRAPSSRKWGSCGSGDGQFTIPAVSPPTPRATSTSPTPATTGSRSSTPRATSSTKWGSSGSRTGSSTAPQGVATDSSGNVYVADGNDRIQKFDSSGTFLTKWGSTAPATASSAVPGASPPTPRATSTSPTRSNHRIQKFDSSGTFLTKWGHARDRERPVRQSRRALPPTPRATSTSPTRDNDRIQKFDSSGQLLTKWGSSGSGNGQFDDPNGVATDSSGNVYVADSGNNRIQKFDSSGTFITQVGKLRLRRRPVRRPAGVATDSVGQRLRRRHLQRPDPEVRLLGDLPHQVGKRRLGNGQFNGPGGVATDSSGNVYVADDGNNRIQKFDSSGTFLTKWGSSGSGNGQFNGPAGVATDSSGNVYVADSPATDRIEKFELLRCLQSPSGEAIGPATASSIPRRRRHRLRRATSTSPTPATTGSRSSDPARPPDTAITGGPIGRDQRPDPDLHLLLLGARRELRVQARLRPLYALRLAQHHAAPRRRLPHPLRPGRRTRTATPTPPRPRAPSRSDRRGRRLGHDPRGHGRGGGQGQPGDHPALCLDPAGNRRSQRRLHRLRPPRRRQVHPKRRLHRQLQRRRDHPDQGHLRRIKTTRSPTRPRSRAPSTAGRGTTC